MSALLPIASLPEQLSFEQAVEAVHREDLDFVVGKLVEGLSVLVECDKQLVPYFYRALRDRLKRAPAGPIAVQYVGGRPRPEADGPQGHLLARMLLELQQAVAAGGDRRVLVLPHLDLLASGSAGILGGEARETAAMLYEDPSATFLGFKDPSFELPKVVENLFPVRRSLVGIPREKLAAVILRREARKLGAETFNSYALYKYLSGLNPVRCRQVLSQLGNRLDYDARHPEAAAAVFRDLRRMTVTSDLEVPRVDLRADIGGYADVKQRLESEILELLALKEASTDPEAIRAIEQLVPKGIILYGPPGTGKTYFAKAIATALDATLTVVSGPELKSKWVGESEENLRRVFAQARRSAPAIIVFDELDSFASARGGGRDTSGVEHSMVNQLLTEMDGFRKEELVFVVGTTNLVESVDPALLRPGRFELLIQVPYPEDEDRRAILEICARKLGVTLPPEVLDEVVARTGGWVDPTTGTRFSGDHLDALVRALRREQLRRGNAVPVTSEDVDRAINSRKRKPVVFTEEESWAVAVHEAGHAVCAWVLPSARGIQKITIASREGDMLGYVAHAPKRFPFVTTRSELLDEICVSLGSRAAEKLILGDLTAGVYGDLQDATSCARSMVEDLGMCDAIGARSFRTPGHQGEPRPPADAEQARADAEISRIIGEQQRRAEEIIAHYRGETGHLAKLLVERQTLGPDDVKTIFGGRTFKGEG